MKKLLKVKVTKRVGNAKKAVASAPIETTTTSHISPLKIHNARKYMPTPMITD